MENPVFNEIKNWHLFTEKFGEEYLMHDASIKRFDFNGDELTVVLPQIKPIRGGTDGAQLSFMGLPCPNMFAGGINFHSRYEFVSLQVMEKAMMTIVKIIEGAAKL